ncbi:MAG: serine--tRNA ligase [Armatimonadota bacterium]
MLDIRRIRLEPDVVKELLARRGEDVSKIDDLLALDVERRKVMTESETRKAEQNRLGPQIAQRRKAGEDASDLMAASTELKALLVGLEERVRDLDAQQEALLGKLPNTPLADVIAGGEDQAVVLTEPSRPVREFDFDAKAHWDILDSLCLTDAERAVKLAGSGFVLYTGMGNRLQRALIAMMLDKHTSNHGYTEVGVPYVLSRDSITASGHIVKFVGEMYHDEESDLYFVPTAEPAMVNIFRDEILSADDLPIKLVAHTPCWRREAGAAGKDTRGLQRVHQFDKVELFRYVRPEDSDAALEEMTRDACNILDALEIPWRLLGLAAGDIAFSAAKTIDIEAWSPGVGKWLEVSSASCCTDFQSRRAKIRFRPEPAAKPEFVHLLNASGLALPRVVAALLETHQQADGSVKVPLALQPYLGGIAVLDSGQTKWPA